MTQSMVTIISPLPRDQVEAARTRIDELLGNPAHDHVRKAIQGVAGEPFVHFASLHAIASHAGHAAFLVLEFSADGQADEAIDEFAHRVASLMAPVYELADRWPGADKAALYWRQHRVQVGHGLFSTAGLVFSGTPGCPVAAIHKDAALVAKIPAILSNAAPTLSPLERVKYVCDELEVPSRLTESAQSGTASASNVDEPSLVAKFGALAPSFVTTFLWPLLPLLVSLAVWLAWSSQKWQWQLGTVALFGWYVAEFVLLALLAILGLSVLQFRRQEKTDTIADTAPDGAELAAMFARENASTHVQNHMLSHTQIKPGALRMLSLRIAFWAVERLTALNPRKGFLGDIGTIHFARWVTIPATRDLVFLSNYGGSWESYLEDFITKSHAGLTGIWSNTVGFPRTDYLFLKGATDGERFKRFARCSMLHTPFWYSAYPELSTANIRRNALIRQTLRRDVTADDAVNWLALFGSCSRPAGKLETSQIQSIIFGGLGFKPEGRLLALALESKAGANRDWLRAIRDDVSFNDGRYIEAKAIVSIAFAARGLAKLGLSNDALSTFPEAFVHGMTAAGRDRILGDIGTNAKNAWWWGTAGCDVVLLVYGDDSAAIDELTAKIDSISRAHGVVETHRIDLARVGQNLNDRKEPFRFVDGVSQPAIRGTYRGLRNADPIHLVEPGEFILGYPDNRGNLPPGPALQAHDDPNMTLPTWPHEAASGATGKTARRPGSNGSFLVIRQLEQDATAFAAYCEREANERKPWLPPPAICNEELIAAKLIGRWRDGSSLVRNPYMSATALKTLYGKDATDATMREKSLPTDAAATPIQPGDRNQAAAPKTTAALGAAPMPKVSITPDNDYLFGVEDPQGLRCPYGAHVRRANPRDSLSPGSMEQIAITNRHRIIRIGRSFPAQGDRKAGLLFMCLNADIERQFEFIQQTWMGSAKFHGLDRERDPIVGSGSAGSNGFTVATRNGPVALTPLSQFVRMRGGGYFFLPGRQLVSYLCEPVSDTAPTPKPRSADPVA